MKYSPKDKQAILAELARRKSESSPAERIQEALFGAQKAFVLSVAKFLTALCSRRAGKTTGAVAKLVLGALANPGAAGLYCALTRQNAKRIAWKEFKRLNSKFSLGMKFNNTDLTIEFPNGADIRLIGINDPEAAETIRGEKLFGAVLDESQSYGQHLLYVIDEIITPCLIDLDGWLALIGTPNAACTGPFFDATTKEDSGYEKHAWTLLDNPYIPKARAWLEGYRIRKKWSEDNPVYLREWCGRWIKSATSLVYRFDAAKNLGICERSLKDMHIVLGVDLGYEDSSAIVAIAFSDESPNLYVVDTFKKARMLPSDLAEKIREFEQLYRPVAIVADTGGLGKAIVEEMRKRYGLSIRPAEKRNKFEYVELANSDLHDGKVKINPSLEGFLDEIKMLQWDEDRKKEDPRFENHLCDAFLYAWRESSHWGFQASVPPPKPGTDPWADEHEKKLSQQMEEDAKKPWWEKMF